MVKIYGLPFSTCTARVLACCHEKEVEYELIPVNLMAGAHKQKPHLDLNPFGQVPAFQDEELTLFESRAITRYLSKQQQGKDTELLGGTLGEQAMVDVWCEVEAQQFNAPCTEVVMQIVIIPMKGGKTNEEIVKISIEKLSKVLDVYEERLAKHNYLAGDFFSLADLHHLSSIHYLVNVAGKGELITSRPHVNAWWEKISARPAWQKVVQKMKR
ncbi:hypothetical protein SUGI_1095720 [Cryptomeria japonica]|uniref:glutathione S-transferase F13 n=1 Tax=Cryptomeria japonica TaxID=3369 RepID=UPI0024146D3F|nr:glutathione S-transferase F13 [Cryptomeria japonica]GLJ51552.1 hypothetical protein SUGI_1095720 [Cryptomeria japonica]